MRTQRKTTVILLIEDNPDDVLLIRREVARCGGTIEVHVVKDGLEGIRYLDGTNEFRNRRRFPLPDVILLDLNLPRLSGFGFLEWLREDKQGSLRFIPVVVLSGCDDSGQESRAYALGANLYLVKPGHWSQFAEVLQSIAQLWRRQPGMPAITDSAKLP